MWDDLRVALRRLRQAPGFTVVAVTTLALAIGANTAIFSIADAVLFRPLPYDDPGRVFVLRQMDPRTGEISSAPLFDYVRPIQQHHEGVEVVGLRGTTIMMAHGGEAGAEWMESFSVSPDYLPALGVRPHRGRLFTPGDAGSDGGVVMLSYESWRRRFGSDESIVGSTRRIGGVERQVIGVLPPGFIFPVQSLRHLYSLTGRPDFIRVDLPPAAGEADNILALGDRAIDPVVRLRPGVSREQAQARLDAIAAAVTREAGLTGEHALVLQSPRAVLFPTGQPILLLLVGAAGLVLAIGCANLAAMLNVRARQRARELGVRAALGATRFRMIRPVLLEGIVLALAGAALALAATTVTFDGLARQVPEAAFGIAPIGVDWRVAGFALMLGIVAAVACAAFPSWLSARLDVQPLLRRAHERTGRAGGRPLVAVQVGLAIVLVCGAIMAGRALVTALRMPLGFDPRGVLLLHVSPNIPDDDAWAQFFADAVQRLERHPDVVRAGAGRSVPLVLPGGSEGIRHEDGAQIAAAVHVLPGYFEVTGVPIQRGRAVVWDDIRRGASVAVISEEAARVLLPGTDPLGGSVTTASGRTLDIVGVAADVPMSLERRIPPPVYAAPGPRMGNMTLFARLRARDAGAMARVRGEIAALTPNAPVTAAWWSDRIEALTPYRQPRFQALVLGGFGLLALGLAALGVFAIVAFLATARRRELGVRLALGATPPSLVRLVLFQAFTPVAAGGLLGVAGVYWLRRVAEAYLAGLGSSEAIPVVAAVVTVLGAALIAAWLPARHAARVDPATVLRAE